MVKRKRLLCQVGCAADTNIYVTHATPASCEGVISEWFSVFHAHAGGEKRQTEALTQLSRARPWQKTTLTRRYVARYQPLSDD